MRSEHRTKRSILAAFAALPALLLAALLAPAAAAAAGPITSTACVDGGTTVTCNLWAKTGTVALPGATATVWGYADTAGGSPTLPGPVLVADQGDVVTVNLVNTLSRPTSLVFEGVAMVPDQASVAAAGGSHAYTFTAGAPGTYLYEAGLIPGSQYQVAMGLSGALVVRPTGFPDRAYADPATAFNDEALVVTSEIDTALTNSATPWTFDLRNYAPRFYLVNGRAYTGTAPTIGTTSNATLLLRYANAGIQPHSMGALGLHQRVLAADGGLLAYPRTMVAETVSPGQTADVLVTVPATTATSTRYALYDASFALNNNSANGIGGMLAFIDAAGTPTGTDTTGPITGGVTIDVGTGALAASVSDATTGGSNVAAAEYFLDTAGAAGTGTAMTGAFGGDPVAVSATIPPATLAGLASGTHTVYVRGQDAATNWGSVSSVSFALDRAGPATSALVLAPNPSNGTVAVSLTGTASDVATGNGNIVAAEFFIGAPGANGSGTALTLNHVAPTASLSATISPPVSAGLVSVHAQDAAGNWGAYTTISLVVDAGGPTTSSITANPTANNGSYGQSSGNPTVRISALVSDTASGNQVIAAAEGFIDSLGATGTGFPFTATDGSLNTSSETVYADVPLTTINQLANGMHTIYVRGRDAGGSWGIAATLSYLIDRTAPTFTSITLAPSPTLGSPITLTVVGASDPGAPASGVAGGEYWLGTTVPAAGAGTAFTGSVATIPSTTIPTGTQTIGARVRDAAGNWSTVTRTATVVVVPNAIFSNGFDTGGAPWGWTSRSTTTTSRLNVTTATVLSGTRSLQAQGNNTNYVQYTFGNAAQPASPTYDARFQLRPNGNVSTGKDVLAAATAGNFTTVLFHVRYRTNAGTPQAQIQVGNTANASWVNLTGGATTNTIEVTWQAVGSGGPNPGTLALYVNGSLAQTLTTASTGSVGAVRLGSVTATGATTLMYFDGFVSKRLVSPLVGP